MIDRNSLSPGTRIMDRIQETIAAWGRVGGCPLALSSPSHLTGSLGRGHKIFQLLKVKSRQDPYLGEPSSTGLMLTTMISLHLMSGTSGL